MNVLYVWHRYPFLPQEPHLRLVRQGFRSVRPLCPPRTSYLVSMTVDEARTEFMPRAKHPLLDRPQEYLQACLDEPRRWVSRGRMKLWIAHDLSMFEPMARPGQDPRRRWPFIRPVDLEIDDIDEISSIIAA